MRTRLSLLALILFASPTLAATVYVDINNDTGTEDGTLANPYNTIDEGIGAASDGDVVDIASGQYTEGGMIVGNDIVLRGALDFTTEITGVLGSGFIFESINGDVTAEFLVFRDNPGRWSVGTDNDNGLSVVITLRHCVVDNCLGAATVNGVSRLGNIHLDYVTIMDSQVGVQENDGESILVENCVLSGVLTGFASLDHDSFVIKYTLLDGVATPRVNTGGGGLLAQYGTGMWSGDAMLNAAGEHQCGSCAIDIADPGDPFGLENPPHGGRADAGAYGNTAFTPSGCRTMAGGACTVIPADPPPGGGPVTNAPALTPMTGVLVMSLFGVLGAHRLRRRCS